MRRILLILLALVFCLVGFTFSGVAGYYAHREQIQPVYGAAERLDKKGRRILGLPSETVGQVAEIDTIYLRLQGTTYTMPNNDFINGGALSIWGDDTLIVHSSGRIFYLDQEVGMRLSDIQVPDNGRDAYERLAAEKYPGRETRIGALRYNDIEFIETETLRGLVISYTYVDADNECYRSRVNWLPIPTEVASIHDISATSDDWSLLFETDPCLPFNATRELIVPYMAGGRVAFKAPNLLYLGSGEYHLDGIYRPDAGIQSDDSDYGKTIEINLETGDARHFSKGHRNLQGVTIDLEGRLWTTEHGLRGGDELNLVLEGENYGWPLENLGTLYSGIPAPSASGVGRHDVYKAPVFAWLPSAAVGSLATIDGFHDAWHGDLLVGSLKGKTLFRARIQGERLVFLEQIPIGQRIRDVMQVANDRIALWLDTNELVIFSVATRIDPFEGLEATLAEEGMASDLANETVGILGACRECHAFEKDIHGAGPSLYHIVNGSIAVTAFAGYSDALLAQSGSWDTDRLIAYLTDPSANIPGTYMSGLGVGDEARAGAVVRALELLSLRSHD